MQKLIIGQKDQWSLLEQVGKGDAGEVYKVCSSDHSTYAVLKRPSRNATGGSIIRQSVQIENEGRILKILDGIRYQQSKFNLVTPLLLDEADSQTASTAKYFIISQQAEGKSFSNLLDEARSKRKIFPRELLLKVITALFSLFENIHQKGVLWNDVKADHIFWDDNSKSIMVIDWGNGVILNESRSNALWQLDFLDDYKQMIQEFEGIISSSAPDLIWDLGWPQGQLKELDQNTVTLLKKRVEFADNYFNLRMIEYHAKVRVLLSKLDNLDSFSELIAYVKRLEQMGERVDYPQVFEAIKRLLEINAQKGKIEECQSILEKISTLPEENLEKEWAILYELFSIPEVTNYASFPTLVENACQQNWISLFWELGQIADQKSTTSWWPGISGRIRSHVVPPEFDGVYLIDLINEVRSDIHIKTIQSRIVDDSNFERNELKDLSRKLSDCVAQWEEVDNNKFFGEQLLILRDALPLLNKFGLKINPLIKSLLIDLQQITRQLVSAWNTADFFLARQNLMAYFLWDPQFKPSRGLYAELLKMEKWVKLVYSGPSFTQDGFTFIFEILKSLPDLDKTLGPPVWLQEITKGFNGILENKIYLNIQTIQEKYELPFSWLRNERIMSQGLDQSVKLNSLSKSQRKALESFYHNLKTSPNDHTSMDLIKSELPQFAPIYETLLGAFESQLFTFEQQVLLLDKSLIPVEDEANFFAAIQVLDNLTNWAKMILEGAFESALNILPEDSDWSIINSYRKVQIKWQEKVLPLLSDIKLRRWNQNQYMDKNVVDQDSYLNRCLYLLFEAHQVWLGVLEQGTNPKNVIALGEKLAGALQHFYEFMKSLEDEKEMNFFLSCFCDEINAVYRQIHQMVDHAKAIQVAFEVLSKDEMLQTRMAYNSASDLMFSLTRINESMPDNKGETQISDWLKTYQQVIAHGEADAKELIFSEIDPRHPLFNWFQSLSRPYHD